MEAREESFPSVNIVPDSLACGVKEGRLFAARVIITENYENRGIIVAQYIADSRETRD